ncbi:MAG: C40 family peptidase, partial [Roseiflexaceae bacterium]|nr:C40 family peptidase [Roseiflexaceae bacterium]
MTPWQNVPGVSWGHEALPVAAPPGAARVVQLALSQIGKPYVWGDEGPSTFDCSGLMQWSYGQIGRTIPRTAQ